MRTISEEPITVVIIDDDPLQLDLLRRKVDALSTRARPIHTQAHLSPEDAIVELPADGPVVIFCDYMLRNDTALVWLPDFARHDIGPVVIVTASGDERIAAEAFRLGAADYVQKRVILDDRDQLVRAISEPLRRFKLEKTNRSLSKSLKIANTELTRKNERLSALTDTAHRFVDDVAHEFRTPLTVIKEFASIMSDGLGGEVTGKQAEFLRFITGASRDLAGLIDDFLDSSKLRAQTLRVDRRSHDVRELILSSDTMLRARAATKNIGIVYEIDEDMPPVYADADKLSRSLINLVVNAVKFSDTGSSVTIGATWDHDEHAVITVRDEGPGLADPELTELFERFRQGGESNSISMKGFGLGLNIVKELAEINLGEVSVESEPGHGSVFSLRIPITNPESIVRIYAEKAWRSSPAAGVSVLRVSRTGADQAVLGEFLSSVCHPIDLQLAETEGDGILLIGLSVEPDRWSERIRTLDSPEHTGPPLEIETLGTWPMGPSEESLVNAILSCSRGHCHA